MKRADLLRELEALQPDIILVECDSGMMSSDFHFSKELMNVYEFGIAEEYAAAHKNVILRPFDIEGRNNFFQQNHFFERQAGFFSLLHKLDTDGKLDSLSSAIYHRLNELNKKVDEAAELDYNQLNSDKTDSIVSAKMNWYYNNFPSIFDRVEELALYRSYFQLDSSFWLARNQKMAGHILLYSSLYPGKRIVILTGFYHRYILKELIK